MEEKNRDRENWQDVDYKLGERGRERKKEEPRGWDGQGGNIESVIKMKDTLSFGWTSKTDKECEEIGN